MGSLPEKEELIQHKSLIENIIQVGNLLSEPRLSHLWFTIYTRDHPDCEGPLSAKELVELTDIPQSTVYQDLETLEGHGAISSTMSDQPTRYSAQILEVHAKNPMMVMDSSVFVAPPYIGTVGYGYEDDNVDVFLNRHGHGALYLALNTYRDRVADGHSLDGYADDVPEVSRTDLTLVEPAFEHALRELSLDPEWGNEYDL